MIKSERMQRVRVRKSKREKASNRIRKTTTNRRKEKIGKREKAIEKKEERRYKQKQQQQQQQQQGERVRDQQMWKGIKRKCDKARNERG